MNPEAANRRRRSAMHRSQNPIGAESAYTRWQRDGYRYMTLELKSFPSDATMTL